MTTLTGKWQEEGRLPNHELLALEVMAGRLGVESTAIHAAYAVACSELRQLVLDRARVDATLTQQIAEAHRLLPGLYAAEDEVKSVDAHDLNLDESDVGSDQTTAISSRRQDAEWLIRIGEFLEAETEFSSESEDES